MKSLRILPENMREHEMTVRWREPKHRYGQDRHNRNIVDGIRGLTFQLLDLAEICFKNSLAARPMGRCLGQTATIFRSGLGPTTERYSGKSARSLRAAIAGTSEIPIPEQTSA